MSDGRSRTVCRGSPRWSRHRERPGRTNGNGSSSCHRRAGPARPFPGATPRSDRAAGRARQCSPCQSRAAGGGRPDSPMHRSLPAKSAATAAWGSAQAYCRRRCRPTFGEVRGQSPGRTPTLVLPEISRRHLDSLLQSKPRVVDVSRPHCFPLVRRSTMLGLVPTPGRPGERLLGTPSHAPEQV